MIRKTVQRDIIQDVFAKWKHPLTPPEVHARATKKLPSLGIATVYRTINSLVEAGDLDVVELPGEPQRYETSGKHHHHHFFCRNCAGVFDIEGCDLGLRKKLTGGFCVERHEITFYGLCPKCAG
jgi:Fur family transcriptional regulator, ferric uptake regulator